MLFVALVRGEYSTKLADKFADFYMSALRDGFKTVPTSADGAGGLEHYSKVCSFFDTALNVIPEKNTIKMITN